MKHEATPIERQIADLEANAAIASARDDHALAQIMRDNAAWLRAILAREGVQVEAPAP
jgi:hypothetical protein